MATLNVLWVKFFPFVKLQTISWNRKCHRNLHRRSSEWKKTEVSIWVNPPISFFFYFLNSQKTFCVGSITHSHSSRIFHLALFHSNRSLCNSQSSLGPLISTQPCYAGVQCESGRGRERGRGDSERESSGGKWVTGTRKHLSRGTALQDPCPPEGAPRPFNRFPRASAENFKLNRRHHRDVDGA